MLVFKREGCATTRHVVAWCQKNFFLENLYRRFNFLVPAQFMEYSSWGLVSISVLVQLLFMVETSCPIKFVCVAYGRDASPFVLRMNMTLATMLINSI